ncbi:MAG: phosphoribosyl-AMP cyclohydrolase [Devosiaceae bacterium]
MSLQPPLADPKLQELGQTFAPRFDAAGLVTAVAVDHASKQVLMVAHMNEQAIRETMATGYAHYWSRSRASLWKKGETSGELQKVHGLYTDCDQDAVVVEVSVEGRGSACHNGFASCFYRVVENDGSSLVLRQTSEPLASADELYGSKP